MSTQQIPSVGDILGGGSPILKFETVGTTHKGTVVRAETSQQTDFDSGAPKFWDNGDPMWQIILTLATDQRDPEIVNDDGERRVFVKGNMLNGLKAALRSVGAKTIDPGDLIAIQYAGDGEPSKRGLNPPKQFTVQVKKGAGPVADLLGSDDPAGSGSATQVEPSAAVQDLL